MDVADLDGDKSLEILYVSHATKTGGDTFELRAVTRDRSGSFRATKWGEVESVALPGVTAVPAAVKTLDINHDGQTDLLIFKDYGSPLLILGEKGGPPRPFTGSLGPLSNVSPPGVSIMDLNGPAVIVAQNTYARRVALDADGHWNIKDQYNSGRNSAQILGAAALDTDGDGIKEVVLLDRATKSLLFLSLKDGVYRPSGSMLVGTINFTGLHVADLDGDGRDDLLIAGTDRFGVLQTGRKGQRLKTSPPTNRSATRPGSATWPRATSTATARPTSSSPTWRTITRYRHLRRRPRARSRDHIQDFRAQDLPQCRPMRSNRATWPSATWTETAGPISSWSSTTALWSCARTRETGAKPGRDPRQTGDRGSPRPLR